MDIQRCALRQLCRLCSGPCAGPRTGPRTGIERCIMSFSLCNGNGSVLEHGLEGRTEINLFFRHERTTNVTKTKSKKAIAMKVMDVVSQDAITCNSE